MQDSSATNPRLPPWRQFLTAVDELLVVPVELHCLGGFVITECYGLPRPTADVDYVSIRPSDQQRHLEEIAGRESRLAKKYKVCLQHVGIVNLPEDYEERLVAVYPQSFRNLRICVLEAYDLALSKLERNSPKDREDVEFLARKVPLDPNVLSRRYERELRPYLANAARHDRTLKLWLDACFPARLSGPLA
jgi:hypothetical protein